jgi:hypothetical protein
VGYRRHRRRQIGGEVAAVMQEPQERPQSRDELRCVPATELARTTLHERNHILRPKSGSPNWPGAESFGDKSVDVLPIIFQRVSRASTFFQQVTPVLICKPLRRSKRDFFSRRGHMRVSEEVE